MAEIIQNTCSDKPRTLVVILPWLGATEEALKKYKQLYNADEHRFLLYFPKIKDFLWPRSGLSKSRMVLDKIKDMLLRNEENQVRSIIIHAFSIGCYFYSLMLMQMRRNRHRYGDIWSSISAQIMDSPVAGSTREMAIGVSKILSQRPFIKTTFKNICLFYFAITKSHTVSYYDDAVAEMKYNSPNVASLLITSDNDVMCSPQAFEDFCAVWRKSQYVIDRVWQDSSHAQHFLYHREEYISLVKDVINASAHPTSLPLQSKL